MSESQLKSDLVMSEWDIFFGAASDAEASVYASLTLRDSSEGEVQLSGAVTGPICKYAHTLTASVALRDLGANPLPLAEARIPDPCFWTPEAPYLYEVEVAARRDEQILAHEKRILAIRRLGVDGRSIFLDGDRWVPRAATAVESSMRALGDCRAVSLGLFADDPSDALCEEATRDGVFLVARITRDSADVINTVRRLATYGAVGMMIIESSPDKDEVKTAARNVILCESRSDADYHLPLAEWCDAVVYETGEAQRAAEFAAKCEFPVIAWRGAKATTIPAEARTACDTLQRELAEYGDFAGYFA